MKNILADRNRESAGIIRSSNRKYLKRGQSPDSSLVHIQGGAKSNHEILSQPSPSKIANIRYSDKGNNIKLSSTKLGSR